jgi:Xaa-Pro aminopeptidase
MKKYTKQQLSELYSSRREKLVLKMKEQNIAAIIFEDCEDRRDISIRYLCGHTSDAMLIITSDGKSTLVAWDENLAKENALVDKIIPSTRYERSNIRAAKAVLNAFKTSGKQNVEVTPALPYPVFLQYVDALAGWDIRCRENSLHDFVTDMRSVKDEYEIECTREAARIGDRIIDLIEKKVKSGEIKTETDVALLIEKECRKDGCERTGFDTLAAGPARSFAIHAFPGYTDGVWPGEGLSILDFGVVYNGYTSDTTLTVMKNASKKQKALVNAVVEASKKCLEFYKDGVPIKAASEKADKIFAKSSMKMPHSLGHGIGLDIHEKPFIKASNANVFKCGNIVTLEPGLYQAELGGVRLENDVLITEKGNEVITHSRIIEL